MSNALSPNLQGVQGNRLRRRSPLPRLRLDVQRTEKDFVSEARSKRIESLASSGTFEYVSSFLSAVGPLSYKGEQLSVKVNDLEHIATLGSGAFGTVELMKVSNDDNIRMAVKRIRLSMNDEETKIVDMDVSVIRACGHHPCIVQFYGVALLEGDIWICMEAMDISMDAFYKLYPKVVSGSIPESLLRHLIHSIVSALEFLRNNDIIHRDVKPSNMLANGKGEFKLCDFGISGKLVDSVAKTFNKGCRPYFAPERIEPVGPYDIRSDVWSLGISIIEIANGKHPFSGTFFQMLSQIQSDEQPCLLAIDYSEVMRDFVSRCLTKDVTYRPDYIELFRHEFIKDVEDTKIDDFILCTTNKVIFEHHKNLGISAKQVCDF
ncbi:hypothetical protein ACOME3_009982 [Neoechinorhynchus agilis]